MFSGSSTITLRGAGATSAHLLLCDFRVIFSSRLFDWVVDPVRFVSSKVLS